VGKQHKKGRIEIEEIECSTFRNIGS